METASKKKIAIVNQRYGLEVNGGSEYYTRLIAEKLSKEYDIEVLTTRALDYHTWEDYYLEGLEKVNGIKVRRFSVKHTRNLKWFCRFNLLIKYIRNSIIEKLWIEAQGPTSVDLIHYIRDHSKDYDIFIFVTYLYYPTVKGLKYVAEKSILIPTAHDEPYIYFNIYKPIFHLPKAFVFLTEEERDFVHCVFHNRNIINDVIGIGVDVPTVIDSNKFRDKYAITEPYVIYVGRLDTEKGCSILFQYFERFIKENKSIKLKLVLMGKSMMEIPNHSDICYLGFVSEEDKYNGIAGAQALILPSEFESLSIAVLESMALSVPVLVNENCSVLKGHCDKSNGGLYYNQYLDFADKLKLLLKNDIMYENLKINAKKYIENNFTWESFKKKFMDLVSKI